MYPKFILISGKRCSGKDAAASVLKEYFEENGKFAKILRFNDLAKEEFANEFGYDLHRIINDRDYKESIRPKLCEFTNRQFENYGLLYFVKKLIDKCNDPNHVYIVSDNRLTRESDYFKSIYTNDTLFIRINCPDSSKMKRGWSFDPIIDTGYFEIELDGYDFDIIVNNDKDLKELKNEIVEKYIEWSTKK